MKRAIAMIVTVAACSEGNPPLWVAGVLAPPVPDASSICLFDANPEGPFLASGVMDMTLANEYSAVLLVGNQSLAHGDSRIRLEDNAIVQSAHVVDLDPDGTVLDDFTEDAVAFVLPPTGSSPGFGTLALELVSSRAASAAGKRVVANIRLDGILADGSRVETMAFAFAVDLCADCLVSCPSSGACLVGQDQPICKN